MDKTKQQALTHWLKQQSGPAKKWLRVLMALGILNGLTIIVQAWLFAYVLNALIIEHTGRELLTVYFLGLIATISVRALLAWIRERVSFLCGEAVRKSIRRSVLEKLDDLGPIWIKGKPAGSWATIIIEQIENMQDFYSRYLPQMALAGIIPLLILIAIFPINWAAGLILFITAPLIPLFMALVGNGAAEANRKNFTALARLSGNFLDRLRGIDTLRLFYQGKNEVKQIENAASDFRIRTMDVLKLAFLSSALLEFFTSVSIAVVAVYFGFSYLGDLNFGHYGTGITLFAGFLVLILAPEFFQPLRDLGTFYHAKAQAVGAAETLVDFLLYENKLPQRDREAIAEFDTLHIEAHELVIFSPDGSVLAGPLSFTISNKEKIAIVGHSGAGKSSLLNVLLGFLSYQGSLKANGVEISEINLQSWRRQIAWVGQNPYLPELTIKDNILLNNPNASEQQLKTAVDKAYVNEFLARLPEGLDTKIGEYAARLSVGQAQRVAVARALLMPCHLLLLDEPTASLDANSEALVMRALNAAMQLQTTITITHRLKELTDYSTIWVMDKGVIVQSGNYSQLSQSEGHFKQLLSHRSEAL